jgi:hypothetical protein
LFAQLLRATLAIVDGKPSSTLWNQLEQTWATVADRCFEDQEPLQADISLLFSLARFTRNAVAGVPQNQVEALSVLSASFIFISL